MLAVFGVGQVLWSILWFFLFLMWVMLLFQVTADVFRSADLGGAAKAGWIVFVLLFPYLGVFVYLIARGDRMHERQLAMAQQQQASFDAYIRQAAGTTPSAADEIEHLADLRDRGVVDDEEFARLKARVLA